MCRLAAVCVLVGSTQLALAQGPGDATTGDDAAANKLPPDDAVREAQPEEGSEPRPPEAVPEDKPAVTAVYDKGLRFESSDKNYELKLLFRSQMRFESYRATEANSQFLNKFYISRARFQAEGHVFGDADRYKLELGMGDASTSPSGAFASSGGSFSYIKDLFLEHRVAPGPVWVRFGQWKRPFFRQEMVSDFASEFNERSIANEFAGGGRDVGVALHDDYEKTAEGIEWVFGMFNGFSGGADRPTISSICTTDAMTNTTTCVNGRPTTSPLDFGPTIVARAGWNSARAKGYSEADLEGGPLRYSVAAAYKIDLANFAKHGQASLADNLSHGLELDWNVKVNGLSLSGGAVLMKPKAKDAKGNEQDVQYGFVVQPGLMVVPKHIEVAARFALVTEGSRNTVEALGAFNYFVHGHQLKLATDFGMLKRTGEDPTTMKADKPDIRVRVMGQLEI